MPADTLAHDEAGRRRVELLHAYQFIARFLHPKRNIGIRSKIRRDDRNDLTVMGRFQPTDELHQRARAMAATRINLAAYGYWADHMNHLLFNGESTPGNAQVHPVHQMYRVIALSRAPSMNAATPVTSSTIGSRSSSCRSNSVMVWLHAVICTVPMSFAPSRFSIQEVA